MISGLTIVVILVAGFAAMSPCNGYCVPSLGWHTKSLIQRMEMGEANVVVRAKVVATNPAYPYKRPYKADLEVECLLKDTSDEDSRLPSLLEGVEGFGGISDCAETRVEAGNEYFILLNRRGDRVKVAEVNSQSGAEPAISARIRKVEAKYPQCI